MTTSKVIMILGMHRSGTSLLANWLHHCGLNLGEEYISHTAGNIKGHFEDLEMYNLHRSILSSNGTDYMVNDVENLLVPKEYFDRATEIVHERNELNAQWGWKEPRTCLFLNMWNELIPNSKSIVTFRHFNEVIDSLARRQVIAEKIRTNKVLGYYNVITQKKYWQPTNLSKLLNAWIIYNKAILKYLNQKSPTEYLVINTNEIQSKSEFLIKQLNNNWDLKLRSYPIEKIFKSKLMQKPVDSYDLDPNLLSEAMQTYKFLEEKQYSNYVE